MNKASPSTEPDDYASRPSRLQTTRQLLHTHRFTESVKMGAQPSMRNASLAGLQAALAIAICVPLAALSPWPHLMGFASLGALVALFGRFAPRRSRTGIVLQCALWQAFGVLVMSGAVWLGWSPAAKLTLLALFCGFYLIVCFRGKFGAPGPLILIFAVGASMAESLTLTAVIERTVATLLAGLVAWLICAASEAWRHHPTPERPLPIEPDRPWNQLWFMAARVFLAALIVVFLSHHLGLNHPAWAAMGAVAVMQGAHLHISMHRALQRMAGTAVGAGLAWLLLIQDPSIWVLIVILVLMQYLTEVVIGFNYALAQVLVTPMALLMTHMAAPVSAGAAMAPERIIDTLLGALVGMGIAIVLSNSEDRLMLARHHQSCLTNGSSPIGR